MNKADLTEKLAQRAGIPKVRAASYINILTEAIQEALVREEKVTISDFGTFTVSKRRAFTGHNPKNGQVMDSGYGLGSRGRRWHGPCPTRLPTQGRASCVWPRRRGCHPGTASSSSSPSNRRTGANTARW
jgi:DNA-binding protein HU-beta